MESINEIDFMNEMTFKPLANQNHSFHFSSLWEWEEKLRMNWVWRRLRPQENSPAKEVSCCSRGSTMGELLWLLCFLFFGGLWGGHRPMLRKEKRQASQEAKSARLFFPFSSIKQTKCEVCLIGLLKWKGDGKQIIKQIKWSRAVGELIWLVMSFQLLCAPPHPKQTHFSFLSFVGWLACSAKGRDEPTPITNQQREGTQPSLFVWCCVG